MKDGISSEQVVFFYWDNEKILENIYLREEHGYLVCENWKEYEDDDRNEVPVLTATNVLFLVYRCVWLMQNTPLQLK